MTHTYVRIKYVQVTRMFNITLSQLARSRLVLYDRATTPRTRKQLFDSEKSYTTRILTICILSQILFASLVVVTFSDSVKILFSWHAREVNIFIKKKNNLIFWKERLLHSRLPPSCHVRLIKNITQLAKNITVF